MLSIIHFSAFHFVREMVVFLPKEPACASKHAKYWLLFPGKNSKRYIIIYCWPYTNSVELQKHLLSWVNCINTASQLYLLAPVALFLSSWLEAVPWLTRLAPCWARYMPSQTYQWWSERLCCISSEVAPKKKKNFYSVKRVKHFINLRKHTQSSADQYELQCKTVLIKTRHTTLQQTMLYSPNVFLATLPPSMKQSKRTTAHLYYKVVWQSTPEHTITGEKQYRQKLMKTLLRLTPLIYRSYAIWFISIALMEEASSLLGG